MRLLRSSEQNRLYWKWLTIMGNDIGHSKEAMHFVFKKMLLADRYPVLVKDEFMEYISKIEGLEETTRKLTRKEMADYMDKILEQARELNISLPLPEDT